MLLKLAILISGRGSNMRAILNAVKKQGIPINPVVVISNKPTAGGLRIAKKYGVKTEIVESKGFQGTRWEYDQKIIHVLSKTCHWWYYIGIVSEGEVIDITQYFIKKDIIKIEV